MKPHPADIANAELIARAIRYDIALFLGAGRYARHSSPTLEEARMAAARIEAHYRNGRRALIYAIDANGRSALVTSASTTATMEKKTYAKKFNAERAAKAAGHKLEDIEIVKTKDGFAWRLKNPPKSEPDPRDAQLAPDHSREPQPPRSAPQPRRRRDAAEAEAAARRGELPEPPNFSAPTHARFRAKLARLVELAKAGDIEGLKAVQINPVSTSPKAMARYRDLCVIALQARR